MYTIGQTLSGPIKFGSPLVYKYVKFHMLKSINGVDIGNNKLGQDFMGPLQVWPMVYI